MFKNPITIIGINPGTRYLGIAVLKGSELWDWRIKVITGKWSKEKMEKALKIVSYFIDYYDPNVLAIKKLSLCRSSSNLNKLTFRIKDLTERSGLRIYEYSIKDVEAFFSEEKMNKRKLAEIITSEYPDLFHELNKEKSHKNPYYIRMFEAVALASVCFHQLDKHR
jgi:hypothetical protein